MGNSNNKRRPKRLTLQNIVFFIILVVGLSSIFVTIFYTVPQLTKYVSNKWYISPLSSTVLIHQNGEYMPTQAQIKAKLKDKGFQVKKINESEGSFTIVLETEEKIIVSKKKSLDAQIASLQLVSSRFTIEGKHFVSLDLRYDRPVLISK